MTEKAKKPRKPRKPGKSKQEHDSFSGIAQSWWRDMQVAVRVLTHFNYPLDPEPDDEAVGHARRAFPLIGLAVGIFAAAVYSVGTNLHIGGFAAAVLAFAIVALITGARAEIGLAEFAEAMSGGGDAKARLKILDDNRIGYYGIYTIVVGLLLRAGIVASIASAKIAAAGLAAAITGSIALLPLILVLFPPAKDRQLSGLASVSGRENVWLIGAVGILLVILFLGVIGGLIAAALGFLTAWLIAGASRNLFGGLTGASLAAIQQVSEIVILIVAAASI